MRVRLIAPLTLGGLVLRPAAIADENNDHILAVDNQRGLLVEIASDNGHVQRVASTASLGDNDLLGPANVKYDARSGRTYVLDLTRLLTFGPDLHVEATVRSFRPVFDFLVINHDQFILTLAHTRVQSPEVIMTDAALRQRHAWTSAQARGLAAAFIPLGDLATVASCANTIAVVYAFRPTLYLIDSRSWRRQTRVELLGNRDGEAANPSGGGAQIPLVATRGVTCAGGRFFVLAASKLPRVYEIDVNGAVVNEYAGRLPDGAMYFDTLTGGGGDAAFPLHTIVQFADGQRQIAALQPSDVGS